MGFSVSGSFAILILASFIAFGMLYTAGANGFERVSDASKAAAEDDLARQNTAIAIEDIDYAGNDLTVNVSNEGTTSLSLADTDVVVDNVYYPREDLARFRIEGEPDTELWLPGETLQIRVQFGAGTDPGRVKVVTEYGVADGGVVP